MLNLFFWAVTYPRNPLGSFQTSRWSNATFFYIFLISLTIFQQKKCLSNNNDELGRDWHPSPWAMFTTKTPPPIHLHKYTAPPTQSWGNKVGSSVRWCSWIPNRPRQQPQDLLRFCASCYIYAWSLRVGKYTMMLCICARSLALGGCAALLNTLTI